MLRSRLKGFYVTQLLILGLLVLSYFFVIQTLHLMWGIAYNIIYWLITANESYDMAIDKKTKTLNISNRLKISLKCFQLTDIDFFSFKNYQRFRHPLQKVTISLRNNSQINIAMMGIKDNEIKDFLNELDLLYIKNELVAN